MAVPPEIRLKRFLHYASEEGMYVARPQRADDYFPDKVPSIKALVETDEDGESVILPTILKVFKEGTSITPTAVIFSLAVCATQTDSEKLRANAQRKARELSLNEEDLFNFAHFCLKMSTNKGGQGMRRTITKWYAKKSAKELAEVVVVKSKIHRLRHKDFLKLYHMKSEDRAKQAIFSYMMVGLEKTAEMFKDHAEVKPILDYIETVEKILSSTEHKVATDLLEKHKPRFPHQALPPVFQKSPEVWIALLPSFSLDEVVFLTQHFFKLRLLKPSCPFATSYVDRITNDVIPEDTKLDPTRVFIELKTYEMLPRKKEYFKAQRLKGHNDPLPENIVRALDEDEAGNAVDAGADGDGDDSSVATTEKKKKDELYPTFKLNKKVSEALNKLIVRSFKSLKPTGQRFLIGVDSRNIMTSTMYVKCPFVKSIEAAALLLLSFLNAESAKNVTVTSFLESSVRNTSNYRIEEIPDLSAKSLSEAKQVLESLEGGPVNILKFFDWAVQKEKDVDVFVLLTSSGIIPCEPYNGIVKYCTERKKEESDVKLIIVSLNGTVSRPRRYYKKSNMLYINGFDDKVWRIIQAFCRGAF